MDKSDIYVQIDLFLLTQAFLIVFWVGVIKSIPIALICFFVIVLVFRYYKRITNYLLVRRFEVYIGNSLNRYLDTLNVVREVMEEKGERHDELEERISQVADAIKRNDVMTHKGRILIPDGLIAEASE